MPLSAERALRLQAVRAITGCVIIVFTFGNFYSIGATQTFTCELVRQHVAVYYIIHSQKGWQKRQTHWCYLAVWRLSRRSRNIYANSWIAGPQSRSQIHCRYELFIKQVWYFRKHHWCACFLSAQHNLTRGKLCTMIDLVIASWMNLDALGRLNVYCPQLRSALRFILWTILLLWVLTVHILCKEMNSLLFCNALLEFVDGSRIDFYFLLLQLWDHAVICVNTMGLYLVCDDLLSYGRNRRISLV